jgi:2-dehydropantoate 2-reductase
MDNPNILILGSGAMACFFAAALASSGLQVCMVDEWVAGIQAIRDNGITLNLKDQALHQYIRTCLPGETIPQCQIALVLVKSWQTEWAADQLINCLPLDGIAVTLQNGLGNDLILKNRLGETRVCAGSTTLGATLVSPGLVNGFENGVISLQDMLGIEPVLHFLQKARFITSLDSSIERIIWGKLIINAARSR